MSNKPVSYWMGECGLCERLTLLRNGMCGRCDHQINSLEVYEEHLNELIEAYSPEMDERCGACGGNLDHNYRCRNLNCEQHYIR